MKLPRLLEEGRVEVKIDASCTHVFNLKRLDELITHLNEARKLLTGQDALADARDSGLREAAGIAGSYCIVNCKSHHDDAVDTTAYSIRDDILTRLSAKEDTGEGKSETHPWSCDCNVCNLVPVRF